MAITDDVRKTFTDPTPLYFVAGTADLAVRRLKEVPALVEKVRAEAPERLAAVRAAEPQAVQEQITQRAKEAQEKLNELLGSLDTDLKKLRDTAQDLALQGVGRAAEFAVRARETYEEVADHGREAVKSWRGEIADEVVEVAEKIEAGPGEQKPAPARKPATEEKAASEQKPAPAARSGAGTANGSKTAPRTGTANGSRTAPRTAAANGTKAASKPAEKSAAEKPAAKKTATARKTTPPKKTAPKSTD